MAFKPLSFLLGLYTAYSFAMIFSFFGSYAYIYSTIYHFNARQIGLCYIPVIIGKPRTSSLSGKSHAFYAPSINIHPGFLFAVLTFGVFDALKYQKAVRTSGKVVPEYRLYAALFGSPLVPIGLFVSLPHPHHSKTSKKKTIVHS